MSANSPIARNTQLANGAVVSLEVALRRYESLVELSLDDQSEWDLLYHLRQLCFGQEVDTAVLDAMVSSGALPSDGQVDRTLREVVLSSVRGTGRSLRVESPFTEPLDRAIGEYDAARQSIIHLMGGHRQAAPTLKRHDKLEGLIDDVLREDWGKRVRRDDTPPGPTGPG